MRFSLVLLLALAPPVACKENKDKGDPPEAPSAKPAPKPEADAAPPAPVITPEQRQVYRQHLAAGRAEAHGGKWRDAAGEFSAALEAIPMDGRALSELGWASFQAGDHDLAREANRKSVLASSDPSVKAASLYNLGRVTEATGSAGEAARHYRASLKLRDNATVRKRLARLGEPAREDWKIDPESVPCRQPAPPKALCSCLETRRAADYTGGAFDCDLDIDADDGYGIIRTTHGHGDVFVQLVGRTGDGWRVAAILEHVYNPGAFGIFEELGQDLVVERRSVGSSELLWIEVIKFRTDRDLGLDEVESAETKKLTICRLPSGGGLDCVFQAPIAETYQRSLLGSSDDPDIEHTPNLPIRRSGELAAELAAGGELSVTLAEGQKTPQLAPYIGVHDLW